jgi:hypothetical protein
LEEEIEVMEVGMEVEAEVAAAEVDLIEAEEVEVAGSKVAVEETEVEDLAAEMEVGEDVIVVVAIWLEEMVVVVRINRAENRVVFFWRLNRVEMAIVARKSHNYCCSYILIISTFQDFLMRFKCKRELLHMTQRH